MNNYSKKEILVFNAVVSLVSEGIDLNEVKVQDIANKALVGKGTLYEYFDSKESIFVKTIQYHMDKIVDTYMDIVDKYTFDDSIIHLLEMMEHKEMGSSLKLIVKYLLNNSGCQFVKENDLIAEYTKKSFEIIDKLIDKSIEEEAIKEDVDRKIARYVISTSLSSYVLQNALLGITKEDVLNLIHKGLD